MSLLSNLLRKQTSPQAVQDSGQPIIEPGQLLSNRYLVSDLLGRGAMGEVYLAEDTVLGGVSVAIKVISQTVPSQQLQDKFAREAQIGAFLGHHNVNIVRVLDFGVHKDDIPFYVMEYVYGSTLAEEIAKHPLAIERAIRLISQVCAGLQSAHQGVLIDKKLYSVIHRDLKPANIFITSNSSFGEIAKILDFGIAEFFLPTHKSKEVEAMGTLAYASSEQLQGKKLEPSADIYSLGITLFESITGQLPIKPTVNSIPAWIAAHQKQPPLRLAEVSPHLNIPEGLEALIQKCLAKKPRQRPQTIQEVLDDLKTISQTLGASFPIKTQSHDEVLDELFREAGPSAPATAPYPVPGRKTENLAATGTLHAAAIDIQPSQCPLSQTQRLLENPVNVAGQLAWPNDKPQAEIVFAQSFQTGGIDMAALWAMLCDAALQQKSLPLHRIEFAVEFNPHPMLAWVMILYSRKGHMRCLPCFLDLMNPQRQQLIQQVVQQSGYQFLLFDMNHPQRPAKTAHCKIDERQRRLLYQSVTQARRHGPKTSSQSAIATSKKKLKFQYEALKARLSEQLLHKS